MGKLIRGLLLVVGFLAAGCRANHVSQAAETKDSTYTKETIRYVEVEVPGDSIPFAVQIDCDPATNKPKPLHFQQRGKSVAIEAAIDESGILKGFASCDAYKALVAVKDKELFHLRSQMVKLEKLIHTPTSFDMFLRWLVGILVLISIIIYLLFKFKINGGDKKTM